MFLTSSCLCLILCPCRRRGPTSPGQRRSSTEGGGGEDEEDNEDAEEEEDEDEEGGAAAAAASAAAAPSKGGGNWSRNPGADSTSTSSSSARGRSAGKKGGKGDGDDPGKMPGLRGSRCFEILGFDIMIDSKLRPWLIEVNHLPSFGTDSPLDLDIKARLMAQVRDASPIRSDAAPQLLYSCCVRLLTFLSSVLVPPR